MIEKDIKNNDQQLKKADTDFNWMLFVEMSFEFVFIILIPLLIFLFLSPILAFIGFRELSELVKIKRETSNLYNIIGLFSAIILSFYIILKKIIYIQKTLKQNK
jgi:hypothetical protein